MSVIFVVAPVVGQMAWPVLSAAIASTMASMGYTIVRNRAVARDAVAGAERESERVELELKNAEAVGETMAEDERLVMEKDGVTLTFTRGADGKCRIHAEGAGKTRAELEKTGAEAGRRIIQTFVYQKVVAEAKRRGFMTVAEEVQPGGTIKLRFKKWG